MIFIFCLAIQLLICGHVLFSLELYCLFSGGLFLLLPLLSSSISSMTSLFLELRNLIFNLSESSSTVQVLKESFKIYCAINDGIINLVDKVY